MLMFDRVMSFPRNSTNFIISLFLWNSVSSSQITRWFQKTKEREKLKIDLKTLHKRQAAPLTSTSIPADLDKTDMDLFKNTQQRRARKGAVSSVFISSLRVPKLNMYSVNSKSWNSRRSLICFFLLSKVGPLVNLNGLKLKCYHKLGLSKLTL